MVMYPNLLGSYKQMLLIGYNIKELNDSFMKKYNNGIV